jgi:Type II secretion system (T2SS), protein N
MASLRRPVAILAAVVGAAAIAAAWLAPATLVDSRLARLTGGGVRLAETEGTVWRASGVLVAGTARIPVAWRLEAWPLLRGELRVHLLPDATPVTGAPRADIAIAADRVELRNVDATFSAALLGTFGRPGNAWVPGGDLHLSATAINWTPPSSDGEARLEWRRATVGAVGGPGSLDVGDVSLVLRAEGDRLFGPVFNVGGELAVRGEITYRSTEGTDVSLLLTPRQTDNSNLVQLLSVVGAPEAGGWRVRWRQPPR